MILFFIFITIIYITTIGLLVYGFDKVESINDDHLISKTTFSIIVPFRNEEKVFLNLLNSISNLNYPKNLFEIVVVNDDSTDNSVTVFNKWKTENSTINSRLLNNVRTSNSPKKDAILTAISTIENEWIITTDADCIVPKNWLLTYDDFIQNNGFEMVVGAVILSPTLSKGEGDESKKSISNDFLTNFQYVDMLSLQGTTIGSFGLKLPFMCNGANFAYTKNFFLDLNGFDGNHKIASGDDVFLLQKAVEKCKNKVGYLKKSDAIVYTKPEENWSKLFQQRVRWASKTGSYSSWFGKYLAVIVFTTNLSLPITFCFLPFAFCLFFINIKILIDYILLFKTNSFFKTEKLKLPLFSSLFYPIFSSSVAIYSLFGNFNWKGRRFKS